jgi:hypothetical protein
MPRPSSQISVEGPNGATAAIAHGSLQDFYDGISARLGVVQLDFYEQMRKEHCEFFGFNYEFTSGNYTITTCPRQEWLLITEGLGAEACENVKISDSKSIRRRSPANWWDHTDPSNRVVLHSDIVDVKARCKEVLNDLCAQFKLLREELIAIILYTGPMYTVYNGILSKRADFSGIFAPVNFTTTIHAIISAIQKLSLQTPVQSTVFRGTGGWGYLPDCFWDPQDGLNVYGFTEFGVMSMTSSKEIALEYSGVLRDRSHPAVLAFAAGAVDRGAKVQPLSQFPFEVEFTFPPCSYIQPEFVNGEHRIELLQHPDKPDVDVPVIYVRVNANIRSPTFDELNKARKQNHIAAFRAQNRDTVSDIQRLCVERRQELMRRISSHRIPHKILASLAAALHTTISENLNWDELSRIIFFGFQAVVCQQCEEVLSLHQQQDESVFLDKFEHARLVTEMTLVRKWAVAKVLWFIEDKSQIVEHMVNYPLQKSFREYVSFCRSRIQQEEQDGRKRQAMSLCLLLGLVGAHADSSSFVCPGEESAIVQAVENGASSHDVELMLDAGFPVDSTNPAGNSLLAIAVRYGYLHLAELFIKRGANVNFVNLNIGGLYDGARTPLIFAASNGHATCLKLLLDSGATASVEALASAIERNHRICVDILHPYMKLFVETKRVVYYMVLLPISDI